MQDNSFDINGSIQISSFNLQNKLQYKTLYHNKINQSMIDIYKKLIGNFSNINYPYNATSDDNEQLSLSSNPLDFVSKSGQIPFLQTVKIVNKKDLNLVGASQYMRNYQNNAISFAVNVNSSSSAYFNNISYINNPNDFVLNSNLNHTIIENNDKQKWVYIYQLPSNQSDSDSTYHNGLRIDISGPQKDNFFIQIAYDFSQNDYNDFSDLPQPIMPCLNGKPINKQFLSFQGGALLNSGTYSYFYDMYPRYCKLPKRILFYFQHCFYNKDTNSNQFDTSPIQIAQLQFIRHKINIDGPVSIYFSNNGNIVYKSDINKIQIIDNSICYFTSINYDNGTNFSFTDVGLCVENNRYTFQKDSYVNSAYINNCQNLTCKQLSQITDEPFYRYVINESSVLNDVSKLTTADVRIQNGSTLSARSKSNKNRIDIVYKINFSFGQ